MCLLLRELQGLLPRLSGAALVGGGTSPSPEGWPAPARDGLRRHHATASSDHIFRLIKLLSSSSSSTTGTVECHEMSLLVFGQLTIWTARGAGIRVGLEVGGSVFGFGHQIIFSCAVFTMLMCYPRPALSRT